MKRALAGLMNAFFSLQQGVVNKLLSGSSGDGAAGLAFRMPIAYARQHHKFRSLESFTFNFTWCLSLFKSLPMNSKYNSLYLSLNTFSSRPTVSISFLAVQYRSFLEPRFLKQISAWLNITKFFLQFYIEIWHIKNDVFISRPAF